MRLGALAVIWIVVASVGTSAAERMPLPSVDLTATDGRTIRSDGLAQDGTWILVYVHGGCASCEAPLAALDRLAMGEAASRIAIVVETADPAVLAALAGRYPALASAHWVCDASGALGRQIAPLATAAIVGVQRTVVEWTLAGVVTDGTPVTSVVRAWLERAPG